MYKIRLICLIITISITFILPIGLPTLICWIIYLNWLYIDICFMKRYNKKLSLLKGRYEG